MVQVYPLLTDLYVHLHCHVLESAYEALPYIFQIVVAHNQIYLAIQPVKYFSPLSRTAKAEISQVKDNIVLPDCTIPIGYDSFIHHLHILERSVAESNYIPMIKMGVRCKEHLAAVKFKLHFFSIYVHHCTLIIWLLTAHQTEMTEEHHESDCHKWAQKIVGKFGKDSPTIQFIFSRCTINVLAMFAGKYLLYEVQCMKHEHSAQIQCVYCSELRL